MPTKIQFEASGVGTDYLLSSQFLLDHEEVQRVVADHNGPHPAALNKVRSGKTFELERQDGQGRYGFLSVVEEDVQKWLVYISKPPGICPTLFPRLVEVLTEKEPTREISGVVEVYPFPDVE